MDTKSQISDFFALGPFAKSSHQKLLANSPICLQIWVCPDTLLGAVLGEYESQIRS
jgi:hypothetical protein